MFPCVKSCCHLLVMMELSFVLVSVFLVKAKACEGLIGDLIMVVWETNEGQPILVKREIIIQQ